jgi:cell division ATPase FtsA
VGKTTNQPAASVSAVTNNLGCDTMCIVTIGATSTTISIGGNAALSALTSVTVPLRVPYGQTITASQITNVSYLWFGD